VHRKVIGLNHSKASASLIRHVSGEVSSKMAQDDRVLRLIDLAYQAAVDPGQWPAFLQNARTLFRSADASLLSHNLVDKRPGVAVSTLAPEVQRAYLQRWGQEDPWARSPVTPTLGAGNVAVGEQLISRSDLERTAFHGDFGRHVDVERVIVLMIEDAPQVLSALSLSRSARRGEFRPSDTKLLKVLGPHVRRALQIHRRLIGAEGFAGGLVAALDRLAHGVLMVGAAGAVLFANRAAEEMLRTNDALTVHNGELRARRAAETTALRRCIASVVGTSRGDALASGGMVVVERESGKSPLRILVTPMPRHDVVLGAQRPAAVLFITDAERTPVPAAEHLKHVFGLSAAETRVATALLDGESVERLADRLCISRNTARKDGHLASVRSHTRSSRGARSAAIRLNRYSRLTAGPAAVADRDTKKSSV
jgi:hypothetical protein